jgi:hypothetical protein
MYRPAHLSHLMVIIRRWGIRDKQASNIKAALSKEAWLSQM